jgi:hypothetical protein
MEKTTKCATCLFAPAALILTLGCKQKPVDIGTPPTGAADLQADPAQKDLILSRNIFLGNWAGKDRNDAIYTLKFTNDLQWESHIEEDGIPRPHYKGTYEPEGPRVRMKVTEEADLKTFGWRPERGNMPASIMGTISGSTLTVGSVLTDAELKRR